MDLIKSIKPLFCDLGEQIYNSIIILRSFIFAMVNNSVNNMFICVISSIYA
jgi:hypothetical protein